MDSEVYVGQTMQNGGKVTATGVATSFVVGAGFSAVGAVVSNNLAVKYDFKPEGVDRVNIYEVINEVPVLE